MPSSAAVIQFRNKGVIAVVANSTLFTFAQHASQGIQLALGILKHPQRCPYHLTGGAVSASLELVCYKAIKVVAKANTRVFCHITLQELPIFTESWYRWHGMSVNPAPNKSLKDVASPLDSLQRRMLRILRAVYGCPLALRYMA
jgi:hypothetical protein